MLWAEPLKLRLLWPLEDSQLRQRFRGERWGKVDRLPSRVQYHKPWRGMAREFLLTSLGDVTRPRRGDGWFTLFRVSKAKDRTIQWSTYVVCEPPCAFDISPLSKQLATLNMVQRKDAAAMHREPRFRNGVCMAACRKPKGWNNPKAIRPLQVMKMKRKDAKSRTDWSEVF